MTFKSKSKRKSKKYNKRNRCKVTRKKRARFTKKMKGGGKGKSNFDIKNPVVFRTTGNTAQNIYKKNRQLIGLASNLKNAMFEYNKNPFDKTKRYLKIDGKPEINVSGFIREKDINIVGPDFDPIRDEALQYVLKWHHANYNLITPWSKYVGKLCEVPPGFFVRNPENNQLPGGNLYNVKENNANFNQDFPTNANIVKIPTYILGRAAQNSRAMNSEGQPINPGKYKFVLMADNIIRYIPDTGNRAPYYYFPSIMLYFYNIGVITLEELKESLGNELPHSLLFNPRKYAIKGAGDFTVDQNGYIIELTGYSGHTKPLPSNVALSAHRFNNLGYPLIFVRDESVRLQTGNTDRTNNSERLIGTYLNVIYARPQVQALVEAVDLVNDAGVSDED